MRLKNFFTSFGNHMKCILIKYLIKATIFFIKTTIFVAILCIKSSARDKTGTMGVQKMQLLLWHSFIMIIIIVVVVIVVVGHLKSFLPQKQQIFSFKNNTGPKDRRTDGQMDGHNLL